MTPDHTCVYNEAKTCSKARCPTTCENRPHPVDDIVHDHSSQSRWELKGRQLKDEYGLYDLWVCKTCGMDYRQRSMIWNPPSRKHKPKEKKAKTKKSKIAGQPEIIKNPSTMINSADTCCCTPPSTNLWNTDSLDKQLHKNMVKLIEESMPKPEPPEAPCGAPVLCGDCDQETCMHKEIEESEAASEKQSLVEAEAMLDKMADEAEARQFEYKGAYCPRCGKHFDDLVEFVDHEYKCKEYTAGPSINPYPETSSWHDLRKDDYYMSFGYCEVCGKKTVNCGTENLIPELREQYVMSCGDHDHAGIVQQRMITGACSVYRAAIGVLSKDLLENLSMTPLYKAILDRYKKEKPTIEKHLCGDCSHFKRDKQYDTEEDGPGGYCKLDPQEMPRSTTDTCEDTWPLMPPIGFEPKKTKAKKYRKPSKREFEAPATVKTSIGFVGGVSYQQRTPEEVKAAWKEKTEAWTKDETEESFQKLITHMREAIAHNERLIHGPLNDALAATMPKAQKSQPVKLKKKQASSKAVAVKSREILSPLPDRILEQVKLGVDNYRDLAEVLKVDKFSLKPAVKQLVKIGRLAWAEGKFGRLEIPGEKPASINESIDEQKPAAKPRNEHSLKFNKKNWTKTERTEYSSKHETKPVMKSEPKGGVCMSCLYSVEQPDDLKPEIDGIYIVCQSPHPNAVEYVGKECDNELHECWVCKDQCVTHINEHSLRDMPCWLHDNGCNNQAFVRQDGRPTCYQHLSVGPDMLPEPELVPIRYPEDEEVEVKKSAGQPVPAGSWRKSLTGSGDVAHFVRPRSKEAICGAHPDQWYPEGYESNPAKDKCCKRCQKLLEYTEQPEPKVVEVKVELILVSCVNRFGGPECYYYKNNYVAKPTCTKHNKPSPFTQESKGQCVDFLPFSCGSCLHISKNKDLCSEIKRHPVLDDCLKCGKYNSSYAVEDEKNSKKKTKWGTDPCCVCGGEGYVIYKRKTYCRDHIVGKSTSTGGVIKKEDVRPEAKIKFTRPQECCSNCKDLKACKNPCYHSYEKTSVKCNDCMGSSCYNDVEHESGGYQRQKPKEPVKCGYPDEICKFKNHDSPIGVACDRPSGRKCPSPPPKVKAKKQKEICIICGKPVQMLSGDCHCFDGPDYSNGPYYSHDACDRKYPGLSYKIARGEAKPPQPENKPVRIKNEIETVNVSPDAIGPCFWCGKPVHITGDDDGLKGGWNATDDVIYHSGCLEEYEASLPPFTGVIMCKYDQAQLCECPNETKRCAPDHCPAACDNYPIEERWKFLYETAWSNPENTCEDCDHMKGGHCTKDGADKFILHSSAPAPDCYVPTTEVRVQLVNDKYMAKAVLTTRFDTRILSWFGLEPIDDDLIKSFMKPSKNVKLMPAAQHVAPASKVDRPVKHEKKPEKADKVYKTGRVQCKECHNYRGGVCCKRSFQEYDGDTWRKCKMHDSKTIEKIVIKNGVTKRLFPGQRTLFSFLEASS